MEQSLFPESVLFTCSSAMQHRVSVDRSTADEGPGAQAQLKAARWLGRAPCTKHCKYKELGSKIKRCWNRLPHTHEIQTSPEHGAGKQASAEMDI